MVATIGQYATNGGDPPLSTLNVTFAVTPTVGNTILIVAAYNGISADNLQGVTDNQGNQYYLDYTAANSTPGHANAQRAYRGRVRQASGTFTLTFTSTDARLVRAYAVEVAGYGDCTFDVSANGSAESGNPLTDTSGATATPGQFGLALVDSQGATELTPSSGNAVQVDLGTFAQDANNHNTNAVAWVATNAATQTVSWLANASVDWGCMLVSWKPVNELHTVSGAS